MRNLGVKILLFMALGYGGLHLGLTLSQTPEIGVGVLAGLFAAAICFAFVARETEDRRFLFRLLLLALCLRWLVGGILYYKGLNTVIGPDWATYDHFGYQLYRSWQGLVDPNAPWLTRFTGTQGSGWGMYYYVAALYALIGQCPLAIQLINCSVGASVCVLVYKITRMIHPQLRVARLAGILTAVAPSMVLWSSQGIKEALIMFFLSLCAFLTLKLCRKIRVADFALLIFSLSCLYTLRHYVFYILFLAITAALLFAAKKFTPVRLLQGGLLVVMLGITFAYLGSGQKIENQLDLQRLQMGRDWASKEANSGFGREVDLTDPQAALAYLPLGAIYVLFAPFPWMIRNMMHLAMLPELIVWWLAAPLLFKGYWVAVRRRLRDSFAICLFTIGLTMVYALFQSNFGTAHRQRAQLLIFFYIFISIGWEARREAKLKRRTRALVRVPAFRQLEPIVGAEQHG
jgi:hypothetical protein